MRRSGTLIGTQGFADYGRAVDVADRTKESVEPLAAQMDPWNTRAKHQSLHHVVAKSQWFGRSSADSGARVGEPGTETGAGMLLDRR